MPLMRFPLLQSPLLLFFISLWILNCANPVSSLNDDRPVIVRVWLKLYTYPYKLTASRDWCNPYSPNVPCSPAFRICFLQNKTSKDICQADVKFGGKMTVFANRNTIRFHTVLSRDLYNPIRFLMKKWVPYPSLNMTVTNNYFDAKHNLLGHAQLNLDKLDKPASTKWRAKWNKATVRMADGKMKIILSYQAYYTWPSGIEKQVIHVRDETVQERTTFEEPKSEPLQRINTPKIGSQAPVAGADVQRKDQSTLPEPSSSETRTKSYSSLAYLHHENQRRIREDIVSTESITEEKNHTKHHTTKTTTTTTTPATESTKMTTVKIADSSTVGPNTTKIMTTTRNPTIQSTTSSEMKTTPNVTTTTITTAATTADTTTTTMPHTSTTNPPHVIEGGVIAAVVIGLGALLAILITIPILCYKYRGRMFSG
ncbi:hypothetical protein FBUS_02016 [Fasciolopsis buskii]|uniref:Uncharacterized protein n=1 Tax=Fasciolopsis buskii TaxID=27845 RepID=A0A8E0RLW2_9TREM|nr:hypothetical protein FBUS_02016 [Fasciolopsis buski]